MCLLVVPEQRSNVFLNGMSVVLQHRQMNSSAPPCVKGRIRAHWGAQTNTTPVSYVFQNHMFCGKLSLLSNSYIKVLTLNASGWNYIWRQCF